MYERNSPAEKLQKLFYQALEPAAKELALGKPFRPSDIAVSVQPIATPSEYERARNLHNIKIDFSNTPFAPYVDGLQHMFSPPVTIERPAVIRFQGNPQTMLTQSVNELKHQISLSVQMCTDVDPFITALRAAGQKIGRS